MIFYGKEKSQIFELYIYVVSHFFLVLVFDESIEKLWWFIIILCEILSNAQTSTVCQNIMWMAEYLGLKFCILYIDFRRMLHMESKYKQIKFRMILALYM